MDSTTFMLVALGLSAAAFLANILLWVPILGKGLYLVGKVLRIVGIAIGVVDIWAILAYYDVLPVPL